jgi:hypothetical protein
MNVLLILSRVVSVINVIGVIVGVLRVPVGLMNHVAYEEPIHNTIAQRYPKGRYSKSKSTTYNAVAAAAASGAVDLG